MSPNKTQSESADRPVEVGRAAVAAIPWRSHEVVWIGGAVAVVLIGDAAFHALGSDVPFAVVVRSVSHWSFLTVVAVGIGLAATVRRRRKRLIDALTLQPPSTTFRDVRAVLEGHLRHASQALEAPIVVLWEDADEPSLEIAQWTGGRLETRREAPDAFRPFVATELALDRFATNDAARERAVVFRMGPAGRRVWRGSPIHRALVDRFAIRRVASAAFASDEVAGRLFALLPRMPNDDDLAIVGAMTRHLGDALSRIVVTRRLFDIAALEERDRLSRELHDGVLQSLAGAALHLKRAEQLVKSAPAKVEGVLAASQQMLADEQRDLRFYVQDLRPFTPGEGDPRRALDARLRQLGVRVTDVWGLRVRLDLDAMPAIVSPRTMHELYRVAQEALANAARHSQATAATLTITGQANSVRITIDDNGRGFPFRGRFSDQELRDQRLGPVTLKARVHALGGTLAIESTEKGAQIAIEVPLSAGNA